MTSAIPHSPFVHELTAPDGTNRRFVSYLANSLVSEWLHLRNQRSAIATAETWAIPGVNHIRSLDDVLVAVGALGESKDSQADAALAHLAQFAAHDVLAQRVILQRLLPGIVALARRRARLGGAPRDVFAEVLSTAGVVIADYPIARRSGRVAASMLRDIEYQAFVRRARLKAIDESLCGPEELVLSTSAHVIARADDPAHPFDEIVEVLRTASESGVAAKDVRFAARLASAGQVQDIAAELGMTLRTFFNQRRRIEHELRRVCVAA